ncbi:MAG: cytochrome D1 domain-containing protein, partial [Aquificaceae bacterium]
MKSLLLVLVLLSLSFGGEELYKRYCSSCHGEDRLGKSAPPLLPLFFMSKSDDYIYQIIKKGTTGMPSFENLKEEEIKAIVEFIKKPIDEEKIKWEAERIKEEILNLKEVKVKSLWDYTVVVERGKGLLWIMEGPKILEKVPFSDIHGGIKFSKDGKLYIPSRSGWVGMYSPKEGKLKKVRACIYLRNIALSSDGEVLIASCWLPSSLVLFDKDLNLIDIKRVEGKINAVYELNKRGGFIFTFRDRPYVGFLDREGYEILYKNLDTTLEDFTLDPLEEYLIGTTRDGLRIYSLEDLRLVKTLKISGLPHLASTYFWYSKGDFYFSTPILKKPVLSVWKAYTWEHVKDIPLRGMGFLAR